MRILLRGYYGFGNLGDDILMLSSCEICRRHFPDAEIDIMTASSSAGYVLSLTKHQVVKVVPLGSEPPAQLIIFGGGGVFYDYQKGNMAYRLLNATIKTMGIGNWSRLLSFYRGLKGWEVNHRAWRVGLGIGVGSFTSDSKKYYQKVAEMAQFDWLLLRDTASYESIRALKLPLNLRPSTDLAFIKEYWMPEIETPKDPLSVGFVLKNWPSHPEYLAECRLAAAQLTEKGFRVTVFLFEAVHDDALKDQFADYTVRIWDPHQMTLKGYLYHLAQQSVVITSRAHGTILAGAFGIPAVCLGIEPKLKTIYKMFPLTGLYLDLPLSSTQILASVDGALQYSTSDVERDFRQNREVLIQDITELMQAYKNYAMA
ncbi:MAG: polysaccharide pyruvyl transferase family protein [Cyclobacteriaceae bacterium]|nr:polysaccharide pyruvyl transferase family protein [Cyclobacteriaceae bacterium]